MNAFVFVISLLLSGLLYAQEPQNIDPQGLFQYAKQNGQLPAWATIMNDRYFLRPDRTPPGDLYPPKVLLCVEDSQSKARHTVVVDTIAYVNFLTLGLGTRPGNNVPATQAQKDICFPFPARGEWTWIAPTKLENGNILTDLDHYLLYRHKEPDQPKVWAMIPGTTTRLVFPMDTFDANACFWIVAVRKPATSPPVASDKSNVICLDANAQPVK